MARDLLCTPLTSLMTSCKNLNGGFLSRASVSFGFLTIGDSPCSATCVGSQKLFSIPLRKVIVIDQAKASKRVRCSETIFRTRRWQRMVAYVVTVLTQVCALQLAIASDFLWRKVFARLICHDHDSLMICAKAAAGFHNSYMRFHSQFVEAAGSLASINKSYGCTRERRDANIAAGSLSSCERLHSNSARCQ